MSKRVIFLINDSVADTNFLAKFKDYASEDCRFITSLDEDSLSKVEIALVFGSIDTPFKAELSEAYTKLLGQNLTRKSHNEKIERPEDHQLEILFIPTIVSSTVTYSHDMVGKSFSGFDGTAVLVINPNMRAHKALIDILATYNSFCANAYK